MTDAALKLLRRAGPPHREDVGRAGADRRSLTCSPLIPNPAVFATFVKEWAIETDQLDVHHFAAVQAIATLREPLQKALEEAAKLSPDPGGGRSFNSGSAPADLDRFVDNWAVAAQPLALARPGGGQPPPRHHGQYPAPLG
jgi:hypothetical protein